MKTFDKCYISVKLICVLFLFTIFGCSSDSTLPTPEKIGEKERSGITSGERAAAAVNKMHGRPVAADANIIVEYGQDEKDLLYITRYKDRTEAEASFDLMIQKIATAKNGPFFHLIQIKKYENKVYMTLGMGAVHFIYVSGDSLLWLQTYQSFGTTLPPRLIKLYPTGK